MSAPESPRYARSASKLLARSVRPEGPLPIGDRAAAVAALEGALRGRARRRIWRTVALSAAAASVFLVAGLTMRAGLRQAAQHRHEVAAPPPAFTAVAIALSGGSATVARNGTDFELGRAVTSVGLARGDRMRTGPRARLAVSLSTGTRLDLDNDGDLELSELGSAQHFVLRGGRVQAHVSKLARGERFVVHTPDAEVEVRGTLFQVVLLPAGTVCADVPVTLVHVREGVVAVRGEGGEKLLGAGAAWQTPCPNEPAVVLPAPLAGAARPARLHVKSARPVYSASTLREQNDLYAAALEALRREDTVRALRLLNELLIHYPDGPLTDSARAKRHELRIGPLP